MKYKSTIFSLLGLLFLYGCQNSSSNTLPSYANAGEEAKTAAGAAKDASDPQKARIQAEVTQNVQQTQMNGRAMRGELTAAEKQAAITAYKNRSGN